VESTSGSRGALSTGAKTRLSTAPRSSTWLGGGSGGETAAAAPAKMTGASTGALARDSPAAGAAAGEEILRTNQASSRSVASRLAAALSEIDKSILELGSSTAALHRAQLA